MLVFLNVYPSTSQRHRHPPHQQTNKGESYMENKEKIKSNDGLLLKEGEEIQPYESTYDKQGKWKSSKYRITFQDKENK